MNDVVTKFRRAPDQKPARSRRRWSLATTCLGAAIVTGLIGVQAVLFVRGFDQDAKPMLRNGAFAATQTAGQPYGADGGGVLSTASAFGTVAYGATSLAPADERPVWLAWLETMGFGGACGLIVYYVLIKFFPAAVDPRSEFDTSTSRRRAHNFEDTAGDRRHLGGPIRN